MTSRQLRPEPGTASGAGLLPLAGAKLAPPRLRAGLVERPRIDRALDAGEGTH